ncbi:hypothetical protein ACM66B_001531 [Microbotryomycetes sp. NB124-2]
MDEVRHYVADRRLIELDNSEELSLPKLVESALQPTCVSVAQDKDSIKFWDDRRFPPYKDWKETCGHSLKLEITQDQRALLKTEFKKLRPRAVDLRADDTWWRSDARVWPVWRDPVMLPFSQRAEAMLQYESSDSTTLIDPLLQPLHVELDEPSHRMAPLEEALNLKLVGSKQDWKVVKEERQKAQEIQSAAIAVPRSHLVQAFNLHPLAKDDFDELQAPRWPSFEFALVKANHDDEHLCELEDSSRDANFDEDDWTSCLDSVNSSPTCRLASREPKRLLESSSELLAVDQEDDTALRAEHAVYQEQPQAHESRTPLSLRTSKQTPSTADTILTRDGPQHIVAIQESESEQSADLHQSLTVAVSVVDSAQEGALVGRALPGDDSGDQIQAYQREQSLKRSFDRMSLPISRKQSSGSRPAHPPKLHNRQDSMLDFFASRGVRLPPRTSVAAASQSLETASPASRQTQPAAPSSSIRFLDPTVYFAPPSFLEWPTPAGHSPAVTYPSLLSKPAHLRALVEVGIRLVERSSSTHQPDLIVDPTSCVWFLPLSYLPGRVFRQQELAGIAANELAQRNEAVFTVLKRLATRFENILLVLEEGTWTTLTISKHQSFAYTPPIVTALKQLSEACELHFDMAVTLHVVFSSSPRQSAEVVSKFSSSRKAQTADLDLPDDPSHDETFLVRECKINEMAASFVLEHCDLSTFYAMSRADRLERFGAVCGARAMLSSPELPLETDRASEDRVANEMIDWHQLSPVD